LWSALPVALLAGLLLTATDCSDTTSAKTPADQAATQPVKAPSSAPTGTPTGGSSLQAPDPDGNSTPPAGDPTPGSDPAGATDPYCKKLDSIAGSTGKDDGPATDTPEGVAAVTKALQAIAAEAPDEIKPSMEVIANLLPRADSDDFSQAAVDKLTAAQQVLQPWLLKHCPGDDFAGL